MFDGVIRNKYGYYTLKDVPTKQELEQYYAQKYYQEPEGSYQKNYSDQERKFIFNKISQKYIVIKNILTNETNSNLSFLDIGCGEGWALKFFKDHHWDISGLDFSSYGCKTQNPEYLKYVREGDIETNIDILRQNNLKFNVIWLDNVLEHVLNPFELLDKCRELINEKGLLVVEVPNDFSPIQQHLYQKGFIAKPFWVVRPDHISYFNKEGLISLCNDVGWGCEYLMGDYPIDLALFDERTNYIEDKSLGKDCHQVRVAIENFLDDISPEKTNEFYHSLANLGLGRNIVSFFTKKGGRL